MSAEKINYISVYVRGLRVTELIISLDSEFPSVNYFAGKICREVVLEVKDFELNKVKDFLEHSPCVDFYTER